MISRQLMPNFFVYWKSMFGDKKSAIDVLKSAIKEKNYKEPTQRNIIQVYELIDGNQILKTLRKLAVCL